MLFLCQEEQIDFMISYSSSTPYSRPIPLVYNPGFEIAKYESTYSFLKLTF